MNEKSDGAGRGGPPSRARAMPSRTETADSATARADEIDRQLRRLYQAILDEPVPARLLALSPHPRDTDRRDH